MRYERSTGGAAAPASTPPFRGPVNRRLPEDDTMPQLAIAWDGAAMREIFQAGLPPARQTAFEIRDCRVTRFRYRQGIRSIVLYTLDLFETATGRDSTQWMVGMTYPADKAERVYRRLWGELVEQGSSMACEPFVPVFFIPQLKMLVQTFPFDRYLSSLPALFSQRPAALQTLFLAQFGPGAWQIERWGIEPARYRPLLGATLCYTITARNITSGWAKTRRFYVKIYRDKDGWRAYEFLRKVEPLFADATAGIGAVEPITYLCDLNALVLKQAPGESLEDRLLESKDLANAATLSARGLAALHQNNVSTPRNLSPGSMITSIRKKARLIAWACPHLKAEIREIIAALETRIEEVTPRPTHMDIKLDHLFLHKDRVALIDLDSMAGADPVYDPATLLARLYAMPYLTDVARTTVQTFADRFTDEYFSRVPGQWRHRLPVNYASASIKTALYFVQHQEPQWSEKTGEIIQKAGEAVAG